MHHTGSKAMPLDPRSRFVIECAMCRGEAEGSQAGRRHGMIPDLESRTRRVWSNAGSCDFVLFVFLKKREKREKTDGFRNVEGKADGDPAMKATKNKTRIKRGSHRLNSAWSFLRISNKSKSCSGLECLGLLMQTPRNDELPLAW
jgi:hypothetical protein